MEQFSEFVSNNLFLFGALVIILVLLVKSFITGGAKNVNANEAVRLVNHDNAVVLDVRTEDEYKKGHILNSTNVPLGLLGSRMNEVQKHKSKPVIIVCKSGNRSQQAASMLKKQGFEDIYNLSGGMLSWENANMPVEAS